MPDNTAIEKLLITPAPRFTIEDAQVLAADLFGITGAASALGSERDLNFHLAAEDGGQFVIKIANSAEDPAVIDMQCKALEHIALVDPALPVPKVATSVHGNMIEHIQAADGRMHAVRVVSYLKGVLPKRDHIGKGLYRQMGVYLAKTARSLRGFFHPAANHELLWDLKHAARLRDYLRFIDIPEQSEMAGYFLDRFEKNVLPSIPQLRAQIVHNDLVPDNILVDKGAPDKVVGIIDFGDLTHTLLVVDLATTIAATLRETSDPALVASQIIAGYHEITPLEEEELRVIFDLVGTRLAMLNLIASWRVTIHPDNQDYIMGGVDATWKVLKKWRKQDPERVTQGFLRACGYWEYKMDPPTFRVSEQDLLRRRERLLGPFAYLFYDQPLHIVRGAGVWLFDAENRRYLDAYNNVPQVGHCHPHVVKAISEQTRLLNTSTRYLHEKILALAERITARLPDPLKVCTFVCTGSEANELAWSMAQLVTGNSGVLVTRHAYHGSTDAAGKISLENIPAGKVSPHVKTFDAPLSNTDWQKPQAGIRAAIDGLDQAGHRPAMCIVDTSFVSDGIFTSPPGYLSAISKETRAAGGLWVADEVQGGFGRFGEKFWGFEYDDAIPDIVSMGKPMGNGHPIAAVVTSQDIAEALAQDRGYFNTFGGNPVSCAAGLAVLDVIEKEGLQDNAAEVGDYLMAGLSGLKKQFPWLGPIHGSGLLLGIDIHTGTGEADREEARRIMNHMRQNQVLIGTTGPEGNVLKIRPPLVFEKDHADILLEALAAALAAA